MATRVVGPAVPAERHAGLDRQRGDLRREDARPAPSSGCSSNSSQHGSDVDLGVDALGGEQLGGRDATCTSLPVADEHDVGIVGRAAARRRPCARLAAGGALEHREVLAGEDQRGGAVVLDGEPPRLGRLVGVGGPDHAEAGDGPQRGEVLDRLVGGAVLADARRSRG